MKSPEQVLKEMRELLSRADRYAEIYCKYNNYNAWRTCEVLLERIKSAMFIVYLYSLGVLQTDNYFIAISGIEFDNDEERNEFEKLTFEVNKNIRNMKRETLGYLRALQGITDYGCDNITKVQEICIDFVDLIDEMIKLHNLE